MNTAVHWQLQTDCMSPIQPTILYMAVGLHIVSHARPLPAILCALLEVLGVAWFARQDRKYRSLTSGTQLSNFQKSLCHNIIICAHACSDVDIMLTFLSMYLAKEVCVMTVPKLRKSTVILSSICHDSNRHCFVVLDLHTTIQLGYRESITTGLNKPIVVQLDTTVQCKVYSDADCGSYSIG